MEPPKTQVLTTQQQRRTLAAKKKKYQGRVLLASPYESYWPELQTDAEENFNKILQSLLERVARPARKINWSEIKKLPRNERREYRRKMLQESRGEDSQLIECLIIGVNAVTRGLQSSSVSAVMVAKDADPRLLINPVLTLCCIKRVPVLAVPALRLITDTVLGYSCLALAIKKESDEVFQNLCEAVEVESAKIPMPAPLSSFQNTLLEGMKKPKESPPKLKFELKTSGIVYKYRSSKKKRAFVPGAVPAPKLSSDFLALGMDVDEDKSVSPELPYRRLTLKRMLPNPEKMRKKVLKKHKK